MHLFELAMELGVSSADMAEAAPSLGFEGITPTSTLTPEQVQAFRTRYAPAVAPPLGSANAYPGGLAAAAPSDWAAPPSGPPLPAQPTGSGGGPRVLQLAVIAVAVVGVLGLFAFMFANSGADEQRLERIASAQPADERPTVTGPDGKPLTDKERQDIATYEAAKAANAERTCDVLRKIRNGDIEMGHVTKAADSLDDLKAGLLQASEMVVPLYDEAIPVIPEQAENMRKLKQFSYDTIAVVQASSSPADLQARLEALAQQAIDNGTIAAARSLDSFAMETCGFSTGNN